MSGIRHEWPKSVREAVVLQRKLRSRVRIERYKGPIRTVAGVDVSYTRGDDRCYGGVVVLALPSLELLEESGACVHASFPYVPGLLSFREIPVVLAAFAGLSHDPDVVICDGQGLAHPRGLGLACHLGLWLDRPTLGCAKSRLVGEARTPPAARGASTPLMFEGKQVGYLVRTRAEVKPVYVSPGHRVSRAQARDLVLRCAPRFRLPETTRRAHALVNRLRLAAM